jgi:hypothetical protein
VRFFGETASFQYGVFSHLQPGAAEGAISRRAQDMKKTFAALVAVAAIAGSFASTPASAQRGLGAAVAGGIIGGAIVGGAIASSRPAYGGPVYVEGPPPPPPGCYWTRQRYWDGYAWNVRPIQVCN